MSNYFEKTFEVRVHHCDHHGTLKTVELLKFMQDCAMTHAEILGVGMEAMHEFNRTFVLSRMQLDVFRMPSYGSEVTIKTYPVDIERLFYVREFEIKSSGTKIAQARSLWLVIDLDSRRPVRDKEFAKKLPIQQNPNVDMVSPARPKCSPKAPVLATRCAEYSDIDILGHMNNTSYVSWIIDTVGSEFFRGNPGYSLVMNYSSELMEGDCVKIKGEDNIYSIINEAGAESFAAGLERI